MNRKRCKQDPVDDMGIEQIFAQKQEIIDSKIQMLYLEMGSRAVLKEKNLYSINYDQCGFRNLIYQMCQYSLRSQKSGAGTKNNRP